MCPTRTRHLTWRADKTTYQAESIGQWDAAAQELDTLEGNEQWKHDAASGDYNPELIEQRLRDLDEARASCDIRAMMHLIRTALSRDLGNMGNVELYRHTYVGTKKLIERYVESTIETIQAVTTQSSIDQGIECKESLEGMLFSRQSFGRSALLLSGGGTFGMTHVGVLKALFEAKLLPRIISGASAGSIVSAVMCTRTDEELPELIRQFPYGNLAVFEEDGTNEGVLGHLRRLLTEGSWSDIKHLTTVMRELTGDITFQEAYNRTRRILNICVSTPSMYELPRLLNYVTAPNVMIWSAVAASCSVPLVFNSSSLLVKDPVTGEHHPWNLTPQHFIDGSVDNDLPMTRLAEMFNVNHFIVSQVNPHVVPFLSKNDHLSPDDGPDRPSINHRDEYDWVYTLTTLARDEALHRLQFMAELGFLPNLATKFRTILSQKYSGDINILPDISMHDLPRLLKNPSTEYMLRSCLLGERATWPKLSRIRDRCAIELALDHAVHRLRARVVFSESQRDLRALSVSVGNLPHKLPTSVAQSLGVGASMEGQKQKRPRRRSGGSFRSLSGKQMLLEGDATDEETAVEEHLEMLSRGARKLSPTALQKPRLVRATKSQIQVPQHRDPANSPSQGYHPSLHDAPKPPSFMKNRSERSEGGHNDVGSNDEARFATVAWPKQTEPVYGVASPIEDVETSEHGHSSDADGEQGTEESDPDPYDGQLLASPRAK